MNKLIISIIILLITGCFNKDISKNSIKINEEKINPIIDKNNTNLNIFEKEIHNERINIPNEIKGVYLSEAYLENLDNIKSSTVSLYKIKRENLILNNIYEIIISEDILFILNLHEGISHKITSFDDNVLLFETPYFMEIGVLKINNGILTINEINYIKIIDGIRNETEIKKYITKILFNDKIFINDEGDEIYINENGNILYKNEEYEIYYGTTPILENEIYDRMEKINKSNNWSIDNLGIRVNNNEVSIYHINTSSEDEIFYIKNAEFILIDVLRRKL